MSRVKTVAMLVLAILVGVPLLVYVEIEIGIGNTIRNLQPKPDFNSPEIVGQREEVKAAIDASFAALDAGTDFIRHAASTHDRCFRGQDNWHKRRSYDHSCRFRVTHFYGINGDFAAQMMGLDTLLNANGWTTAGSTTLREMVTRAHDAPRGDNIPLVADPHIIREGYRKNNLALWMIYADKQTGNSFLIDDPQDAAFETVFETYDKKNETYDKRDFQNVQAVYQELIRSHPYVFAISIQGMYFEKPR